MTNGGQEVARIVYEGEIVQGYVHYDSNNSGGYWWLDDNAWHALEAAGWVVAWYRDRPDDGFFRPNPDGRVLGALATEAKRYGLSLSLAIDEWEAATGLDSSALGCGCCGVPHNFSEYNAGGDLIDAYSPTVPMYGARY